VAQTIDWNPPHLLATLKAAHRHRGLAFIRVVQRCPHYPSDFVAQLQADPSLVLLLTDPAGIELEETAKRLFENQQAHDPADIAAARALADRRDVLPVGLFYRNESADRYDLISIEGLGTARSDKLAAIHGELSSYAV
jgi:2-oxoglutarate ferredoxin oxidoreductase subunit beta